MDAGHLLNGRYLLAERLGEGGMSVVWRARDQVLDREVAVKVLASRLISDADWRRRIRFEARAAGCLSHPNITSVYDYGETDDDVPFVVMELLRGPTLAERLRDGPLPPADAIRVCAEVAAGLAAAHAEDLVHRDVKPANVILTPSAVKVLDFGIVGVAGVPDTPAGTEMVLGTPAYLAPERLLSDEVTPASDVYAFGLLLYRCLTGRLPWSPETTTQLVRAHVSIEPEPLLPRTGVPPEVRELCMSCLAKDPADRPAAAAVAARLARAAGIAPRLSAVPPEPDAQLQPQPDTEPTTAEHHAAPEAGTTDRVTRLFPAGSERRRVLAGAGVLALIAGLLVAFALSRPLGDPQAETATETRTRIGGHAGGPAPVASSPTPSAEASSPAAPATGPQAVERQDPENAQGDQAGQGNQGNQGRGAARRGAGVPTDGGLILAACAGPKVDVLQVVPIIGAGLISAELGLHTTARVEFARDGQRLRYDVSCAEGLPVATAA